MIEILKAASIGGLIIGGSHYASELVGPEYASLVGGLPIGLLIVYFLASRQKKENFFLGYAIDGIGMTVMILFMYLLLNYTQLSGVIISAISLLIWAVVSIGFMYIFKKHNVTVTSLKKML